MISEKAKRISSTKRNKQVEETWREGERLFKVALNNCGISYREGTQQENINHCDFFIGDDGIDVKGFKKAHKEGYIVAEFKNVQGNNGSCSEGSKNKYLAFQFDGYFIMVKKDELLKWCRSNVKNEYVDKWSARDVYKKLYTRKGRKDLMTTVMFTDLFEFNHVQLLRYG